MDDGMGRWIGIYLTMLEKSSSGMIRKKRTQLSYQRLPNQGKNLLFLQQLGFLKERSFIRSKWVFYVSAENKGLIKV